MVTSTREVEAAAVIAAARALLAHDTAIARAIYSKWIGGHHGNVHDPANWLWTDEIWQRTDACQFAVASVLRDALAHYDAADASPPP